MDVCFLQKFFALVTKQDRLYILQTLVCIKLGSYNISGLTSDPYSQPGPQFNDISVIVLYTLPSD